MDSKKLLSVAACLVLASFSRGEGLLLSPDDLSRERAPDVVRAPLEFEQKTLPRKVTWKSEMPTAGDQGNDNSCVGWTVGYGLLSSISGRRNDPFSPYYVYRWGLAYKNRKAIDQRWADRNEYPDSGLDFRHAFLVPIAEGCCGFGRPKFTLKDNTIRFSPIDQSVRADAWRFKPMFFMPERLSQIGLVNRLKQALLGSEGKAHPIPCGFRIHAGFKNGFGFEKIDGIANPCLWSSVVGSMPPEKRPLHAMLVVGYNDDVAGGAFEVLNSFGKEFGNDGYLWITYDMMADLGANVQDRSDNPCCVVAWNYSAADQEDSLAAKEFENGAGLGWVRLVDMHNEVNFKTPENDALRLDSVKKGDRIKSVSSMFVRQSVNTIGFRPASGGDEIGRLDIGETVVLEDYKTLQRGNVSEIWGKIKKSKE